MKINKHRIVIKNLARYIHDECEHIIGTEVDNPSKVARLDAIHIIALAKKILKLSKEQVEC